MSDEITVAPGTYVVRNTQADMAGQTITRNNRRIKLDKQGVGVFADDCGIHLCGPEWQIIAGVPRVVVTNTANETIVRPAPGPLKIWKGSPGECEGQKVQGRDGSIIYFNNSGYGAAPENCGLHVIPGYRMLEDATPEAMTQYGVTAPTTLADLQDEENERMIAAIGGDDDDEEDPYRALLMDLARKPLVKSNPDGSPLEPEGAAAPVLSPGAEIQQQLDQLAGEGGPTEQEPTDLAGRLKLLTRASLEVTAKECGVENATSNTRFPNKNSLINAILEAVGEDDELIEDDEADAPVTPDGAGAPQGDQGAAPAPVVVPVVGGGSDADQAALKAAQVLAAAGA